MPTRTPLKRVAGKPVVTLTERLDTLRFQETFDTVIALSELSMDMVEAFASREELIWIQNGFKASRKSYRDKRRGPHSRY
jgi:hypothetical protein